MLVLSRKKGQRVILSDVVTVTVLDCRNSGVRLGIEAPPDVRILREELRDRPPAIRPARGRRLRPAPVRRPGTVPSGTAG